MSLKEFVSQYGTGLISIVTGAVGGIWLFLTNRRAKKIEVEKTEVEKKDIEFDLKVKREKYDSDKEQQWQLKYDKLNDKFEQMEDQMEKFKKLYEDALVIIGEMKAELNLWKTIHS